MEIRVWKWKRTAVSAAAIGIGAAAIGFGLKAVPLLQSIRIGGEEKILEDTSISDQSFGISEELFGRQFAEGFGAQGFGAEGLSEEKSTETDESAVIFRESEASAEMHPSKLYPESRASDDGKIVEKHYGKQSGTQFFSLENGGQVRNCTFWNNQDLLAESKILPDLPLKLDGTPMVLIYHTHTTESFERQERSFFDAAFNYRTTEPDKNMVMVGAAIAKELSDAGIGVIHSGEIHDFPVWNHSYSRSAKTVSEILAEYPSICIALDIHRDAISTDSTIYAPVAVINGKKAAQIMIISGCDDGTMGMPEYRKNFHFASALQQTTESMYEGLTRPILFDYRKYNQDLTTGSLLVEFGSQGNTMEEARYSGELFGKSLAETIRQLAASKEGL